MNDYKIFKYQSYSDELIIPMGSKLISVINQYDEVVIYAIVPQDVEKTKSVSIRVVGTGHRIDFNVDDYTFLGNVNTREGRLIWHVFYSDEEWIE